MADLDDRQARHVDNRAAFTELLEALPPSAHLSVGYSGSTWTEVAPKELAQQWGLEFHSRTFSDTASSPFSQASDTLAVYGLLSGYEDGTFHPGETITRAEFTVMAMRFARLPEGGENPFSDVTSSDWFYDQVVGAVQYGWITGYTDGTFRPEATITRAEVTAITNRLLDRAADEDYVDDHAGELRQFSDVSASYWAYHDIVEATNAHSYRVYDGEEHWM